MSIQPESYYKLVKISDLPTLNRNTLVQLVGQITLYDESEKKIQFDDTYGKHTIELGKSLDIALQEGKVIRIFGNWDGIKISVEKILEWDIVTEKLPVLFSD